MMIKDELLRLRKKENMNQKEMANALDISFSMYQALEYGYRKPSVETLEKIKSKFPSFDVNKIFTQKVYSK